MACCNCKYITLYRGDDSNFEFNQKVTLVIKTELDLSGCSAHFSLFGVQQDFETIPSDKTLELVFSSADTAKFPLGMANGKMWLTDSEGRIRTVSDSIHFCITKDVEKAYGDSSEQTITVDIQSIGNYDALSNKPSINGVTLIGNKTGEELGLADTSALDGKRDVTDLLVRGNPTGEGSWFSVNGDTYTYSGGVWTREGSPFDAIVPGESTGAYVITGGGGEVGFSLDADYSATVSYLGTTYSIIGYVDTLAKVSEIPTKTSQLTNDSGFITSADVHGDYIEDADGNRINADRTIEEKDVDAPWFLYLDSILPYTLEKKDNNYWQCEQPESRKFDLYYYAQEGGLWYFTEYYWNGSEWEFVTSYPAVNESAIGNPNATYLQLGDNPAYGTATRQLIKSGKLSLESAVANKKDKQDPVTDPTASGNATSFIDTISQDANGVITPTKKTIPTAAPSSSGAGGTAGLMSAADKEKLDGIAPGATAVTVDTSLSDSSTNPVQNKAVTASLAQKANKTDLPYALVTISTPTVWLFSGSGVQSGHVYSVVETEEDGYWAYFLKDNGSQISYLESGEQLTALDFSDDGSGSPPVDITATLAGYALLDRAVNAVSVTGETTLTLPSLVTGKSRDFYLKMTVTGSQSVTFSPSTGIAYTGFGNPAKTYAEGTYLLRFTETAENAFNVVNCLAATGSYNDLTDKPTIPAAVTVDPTLTVKGAAADAKAVGDALRSGFTAWEFSGSGYDPSADYEISIVDASSYGGSGWDYLLIKDDILQEALQGQPGPDLDNVIFQGTGVVATRHLITPTKTSQLINDGDGTNQYPFALTDMIPEASNSAPAMDGTASQGTSTKFARGDHVHPSDMSKLDGAAAYPAWEDEHLYSQGDIITYKGRIFQAISETMGEPPEGEYLSLWNEVLIRDLKQNALSSAQMDAVNSGATAEKVATWDGYAAQIAAKANAADLRYSLVTPGEWEFSGMPEGSTVLSEPTFVEGSGDTYLWQMEISIGGATVYLSSEIWSDSSHENDLSVALSDGSFSITATRPSLPGHLCDRAVNAVSASGATTFTLPALVNAGKSRDLLVRLTVSADSAVTFSATTGETVTWDDAGSPSDTYEAGTYLFRFTEVSQPSSTASVFHFDDLGNAAIDPAILAAKLDSTSAAPAFDPTKTYSVGEYVTYEGVLYECSTAVTTAGAWTGSTNWTATDMTSPDATLDLMADGRLRLVSADGEVLWMQGYDLAPTSSVTLSCDKVNFHAFTAAPAFDATEAYAANDIVAYDGVVYVFTAAHAAGAWTGSDASVYAVALGMPTAPSGKVGDFVLDVDNTANASASVTATLTGAGTAFDVFTPEGVNLSTDILTFAGGEQCELYFTMTAFGTAAKPAWKVVKQIVEKQEFGS